MMKMGRYLGFFFLALTWSAFNAVPASSDDMSGASPQTPNSVLEAIPKEPGWKAPSYRGWELLSVPGLISTYYDLDQDGTLDYMVIRKIMRKVFTSDTTMEEAIEMARYDKMAVYFSNPAIYFTNKHPLFYCKGVDFRKNCRDIWVDIAEDGLNGNEELYTLSTPRAHVR